MKIASEEAIFTLDSLPWSLFFHGSGPNRARVR